MYRPIAKYVLRAALFASAITAIACASPTAPAPVNAKKAVKDSTDICRSGWTVIDGRTVCNDASIGG
jgi:hypothetical protein